MKVYRVGSRDRQGKQKGYDYFANFFVANAAVRRAEQSKRTAEVTSYEVPVSREGVLNALNQLGGHPDNG